jgi:Domain of unknown function (DUF4167)
LNNNNRGNNRRRGRGNNNRQNTGGQQVNRIDSRARGNAPQLLEKYRKLAHDGHLNGDRVTEEYYLQFADHYFRVIADTRVRQDEARPRRDDRWQDGPDQDRADSYRDEPDEQSEYGGQQGYSDDRGHDGGRREPVPRYAERLEPPQPVEEPREQAADEAAQQNLVYEPQENPFVRDGRGTRGLKQRRPRGEPRTDFAGTGIEPAAVEPRSGLDDDAQPNGLDASALPPSISASVESPAGDEETPAPVEAEAEVKPRRRARRARPAAGDADETLQAVS